MSGMAAAAQKYKCCCVVAEPCFVLATLCECEEDQGEPTEIYVCCDRLPPLGDPEVDLPEGCVFLYPPGDQDARCFEIPPDPPTVSMLPPGAITFCPVGGVNCQFEDCDDCCPPPQVGCPSNFYCETTCADQLTAAMTDLHWCAGPQGFACIHCESMTLGLLPGNINVPPNDPECWKIENKGGCNWGCHNPGDNCCTYLNVGVIPDLLCSPEQCTVVNTNPQACNCNPVGVMAITLNNFRVFCQGTRYVAQVTHEGQGPATFCGFNLTVNWEATGVLPTQCPDEVTYTFDFATNLAPGAVPTLDVGVL